MHQKTAENPSGPGITPVYVFLDFDGVTHPWSQAEDFRCLPVLEAVLRDYPETRVVISSDWRTLFSLPKLVARFIESLDPAALDVDCLDRLRATPPFSGRYGWEP